MKVVKDLTFPYRYVKEMIVRKCESVSFRVERNLPESLPLLRLVVNNVRVRESSVLSYHQFVCLNVTSH